MHYPGEPRTGAPAIPDTAERQALEEYVPAMHRCLQIGSGKKDRTVKDIWKFHEKRGSIFKGEQLTKTFTKGLRVLPQLTHEARLRQFFECFPEKFTIFPNDGVEAVLFQPPAQGCALPPDTVHYREAPYEYGDWRTVGITTRMVQDVAYDIRGEFL